MYYHCLSHSVIRVLLSVIHLHKTSLQVDTFAQVNITIMSRKEKITFKNGDLKMSGELYLPDVFDAEKKYRAVVAVHPGNGVKEQVAGLYARLLAEQGFVTLAYDASHHGASDGYPRYL